MKCGIFTPAVGRRDGGPETYERHLVENLAVADDSVEFHVFCFSRRAIETFEVDTPNLHFHQLRPGSRWISLPVSLPICLKKTGVDFYHATFIPAPYALTPYTFTMHDISMFVHPEFYAKAVLRRLNPMIERGLRNAKSIICISEHCRQTTAEYFGLPLENMSVVHHGINPALKPVEHAEAREFLKQAHDLHGPYLLYVGKLEARKNIVRLIEAFSKVIEETDFEGDLVLAGRRYWDLDGVDEAVQQFGVGHRVRELGYVPDEHLPALYSAAEAFVFPSLWEGFGFPVLEAMACGTPVVTSSVSSIPEIAGDAAILTDPYSAESIASGIAKVLNSSSTAEDMTRRGLERASQFTWERNARNTLDVYKRTYESLQSK